MPRPFAAVIVLFGLLGLVACNGTSTHQNNEPALQSITVSPPNASLSAGQQQQFSATANYSDGTSKDMSKSASWSSSDTTVATIDSSGIATAVKAGTVSITAAIQSKKGNSSLVVNAATTSLAITETDGTNPITGGGASVLIDGVPVGTIDTSGSLTVSVSPGSHAVIVLDSGARGDLAVTAAANVTTQATVTMIESDAAFAPGLPTIPQISNGVFDYTDGTKNPITVQYFDQAGAPVTLSATTAAYLNAATGSIVDLSSYTSLSGNTLSIDLLAALNTLGSDGSSIAANGPFLIEADVRGSNSVPYSAAGRFELGVYSVKGSISAPPSNPSLPVGNVTVTFRKHSSKISFQATSDSGGAFSIGGVPSGEYDVKASVTSGATTYNVIGTSLIQSNVAVAVVPLGPIDIANSVRSVTTTVTGNAKARHSPSRADLERRRHITRHNSRRVKADSVPATGPYGDSIVATAAGQDFPVTTSAVYTIPQGTQSVSVVYQVCTEEYPYYVETQSQFNDLWSIVAVDAQGSVVVSDNHNVNEQLFNPPIWQGDGCTAVVQPVLDISASTANGDTTVTLTISATDIGDDLLPTTVSAIVTQPGQFSIKTFDLDDFDVVAASDCTSTISNDTSNIAVCETANDGDYISIPPSGAHNRFLRPATAILDFPADMPVTVTNVELDIVDLSGNVLDKVFNEAPGGVVQQPDAKTLMFSITYQSTSPGGTLLVSVPDSINYSLKVSGTQGGNSVNATQDLAIFNTLWSAVGGGVTVGRYGYRDPGGDDWARQATISWFNSNSGLLTRYDDISGEHGRNLGHKTHGKGIEFDIFQFSSLDSSGGLNNYNALKTAALKAGGGDADSISVVANWVQANRSGIDALNGDTSVVSTRSGLGTGSGVLPDGWLKAAMLSGTLPLTNGSSVDLGLGSSAKWAPSKPVAFDTGHNSHIHVSLTF